VTIIDAQAMGLGDGESGTVELKKGDLDKFFKSKYQHEAVMGEKAETEFKAIIIKWPTELKPRLCLMNYYQQANLHTKLIQYINIVASDMAVRGYELVDDLLPYAARYYRDEKPQQAVDVYRAMLLEFPKSAPVLSSYGVAMLKLGDLKVGVEHFEKAYQLDKKDPLILGNLAEGYIYQLDFVKARFYLDQLISVKPEKTDAYFTLAILTMAEDSKKANAAWNDYFLQNKKFPDHEYWVKFAKQIQEIVKEGVTDADLLNLSRSLTMAKTPQYAVPLLASLIAKNPNDPYYQFGMAHAYDVGSFLPEAFDYATQAVNYMKKQKPDDKKGVANIQYETARLAYRLGKYDAALAYAKDAENNNRHLDNVQYLLGLTYSQVKDDKNALLKFKECTEMDNNKEYVGYCKTNVANMKSKE
jgi:tetratricopeptide (TPR) repeat protein